MWQFGHSKYRRVVGMGFVSPEPTRTKSCRDCRMIVQNHVLVSSRLTIGIRHEAVCLKYQRKRGAPNQALDEKRKRPRLNRVAGRIA
jgi:hypothetical protein